MRAFLVVVAFVLSLGLLPNASLAQLRGERLDADAVARIKEEGTKRSKVMETISYLTDVHGPRLTGSPQTKVAGEWTKNQLTEWGLKEAHLEPWGPFGRGWTLESFKANMVEPSFSPLIAYPKAWSGNTPKAVRGEPIYLDAAKEADLEKYRGKLHRAIVLISPPREVKALFDAPAKRQTDEALLTLANAEAAASRGFRTPGPSAAPVPGGDRPATDPTAPGASRPGQPPDGRGPSSFSPESRAALQMQADKWKMAYEEGAAVVLEPGRGDGGTVFVGSATMPRQAERTGENRGNAPGDSPFGRSSVSAYSKDAPEILPQAVLAVEHYNRLVRMLQKGAHPVVEIDIAGKYHTDDLNSFNVIAEIPGSDLKDEIVMLGGHFDSWHSGTGATDNAIGCGVALEAVRILQAIDAKPRRTIRIALWTGEEQGLLGSRAYVADHFGKSQSPFGSRGRPGDAPPAAAGGEGGANAPAASGDAAAQPPRRDRPRTKYELKPDHEKFSAYFNLDNGTGKIRGVHLQGNEAVRPIFRSWLAPFADMGASTLTSSNTGGTDHLSFDGIGLPGFQFIQDPLEYNTRTHHSSMDVYDRIQADDAMQASIIMATFVYHTAMRDEKLPRKPLDGDVVTPAAPSTEKPAAGSE